MTGETAGFAGAIIGTAMGLVGGVVGCVVSIRNTSGPRERKFMIQVCILAWLLMGIVFALAYAIPSFRPWAWAPMTLAVIVCVPRVNRRQQELRRLEAQIPIVSPVQRQA